MKKMHIEMIFEKDGLTNVGKRLGLVAALVATTALGACSSVPDAINPVVWYDETVDYITSDDDDEAMTSAPEDSAQPAAATDDYPAVQTVPDAPETASADDRHALTQGLIADRERARYTAEQINRPDAPAPGVPVIAPPATNVQAPQMPPVPVTQIAPPPPAMPGTAAMAPPQLQPRAQRALTAQEVFAAGVSQRRLAQNPANYTQPVGGPQTMVVSSTGTRIAELAVPPSLDAMGYYGGGAAGAAAGLSAVRPLIDFKPGLTANSVRIASIQFAMGSANLSARDRKLICQVAGLHKQRGGSVRVIGHASSQTKDMDMARHNAINLHVSNARAQAVTTGLISAGVAPTRIYMGAASDTNPEFSEVMPTGEAGNRRAEIFLDY